MAGRIVRQDRLFAALILTAAMLMPGAIHAQDVIVFPPSAAAASTATLPSDPVSIVPTAPSVDAVPSALPTPQSSVPTMLPVMAQAAAVTAAKLDPKALQCGTDADCVLVTDGCGALDAVNGLYAANWKASMPVIANCTPVMDLTKAQLAVQPVCRDKQCGQQAKANK